METSSKHSTNSTEQDDVDDRWRLRIIVLSYLSLVLLASAVLNGTICLLFYRKRQLLTVANSFVLNLTVCQLGLTITVLPFVITSVITVSWVMSDYWCQIQGYAMTVFVTTTQYSLFIISVDRNYAITNSLRYPRIFSPRLCILLIVITWSLGLLLALPSLIDHGQYQYIDSRFLCGLPFTSKQEFAIAFLLVEYCLPCIGQILCYFSIFRAAIRHGRQNNRVYPTSPSTLIPLNHTEASSENVTTDTENNLRRNSLNITPITLVGSRTKYKAVKTLFVIWISYVVCWMWNIVNVVTGLTQSPIPFSLDLASTCFMFLSCVLNPVVFAFMNKSIRFELSKLLARNEGAILHVAQTRDNGGNTVLTSVSSGRLPNSVWGVSSQSLQTKVNTLLVRPIQMVTIQEVSENDLAISSQNLKNTFSNSKSFNNSYQKSYELIKTDIPVEPENKFCSNKTGTHSKHSKS